MRRRRRRRRRGGGGRGGRRRRGEEGEEEEEEDLTALFNNYHPRYGSNEFAQITKLKTAANSTNL